MHAAQLRGVVDGARVQVQPAGPLYVGVLGPLEVRLDARDFVGRLDEAATAPDHSRERSGLLDAMRLWRGTPFEGVRAHWLDQVEAPRLVDRYMGAVERRIDLDLASGLDSEVVGQLRE